MKRITTAACAAVLILAGCGKQHDAQSTAPAAPPPATSVPAVAPPPPAAPASIPAAEPASAPVEAPPPPPPPPHAALAPHLGKPSGNGGETIAMRATRNLELQQCPGASCMALGIIPKHHAVKVDPFGIKIVKEADGTEHSWVKIAYEGDLCWVGSDCSSTTPTAHPIEGWVDYKLLAQSR